MISRTTTVFCPEQDLLHLTQHAFIWRSLILADGVQVVIAFMLSAYFTLLLVAIHYLVDRHERRNLVDRMFLDCAVPKLFAIQDPQTAEKWTRAFEAAVLFFGDTQVITSVAILVSGYVQMPCGLSAYHWATIVDLAWFSALTHLTTLTSLRRYLQRRPTMAILRIIFMGMTLILLGSALYPTVYLPTFGNGESTYAQDDLSLQDSQAGIDLLVSSPAICLFSNKSRKELWKSQAILHADGSHQSIPYNPNLVILSLLYLAISYITRVVRLFAPLAEMANTWLVIAPNNILQQKYSSVCARPSGNRILTKVWKAVLILAMTLWNAFYLAANSMLWEILWLVVALAWGTLRIIGLRKLSHLASEDSWGFGQILAVLLSAVPIWSFFSTIQEAKYNHSITNHNREIENDEEEVAEALRSIEKTIWFRGLISLIFGMAAQFAAEVLYRFPAPAVSSSVFDLSGPELLQSNTKLIVTYYLAMLGFSIGFLIIFTSICLLFHFTKIKSHILSHHRGRRDGEDFGGFYKIRSRLRLSLVLLLCGLNTLFNYAMFHGPPGQPSIFLKWWSQRNSP